MALPDANRPKDVLPATAYKPESLTDTPTTERLQRGETLETANVQEDTEPAFERFAGITHLESAQAENIKRMLAEKAADGMFIFDPSTGEIKVKQD